MDGPSNPDHMTPRIAPADRDLAIGFAALVALTFVLIVLGALVRAHGAGLACPDWPLCFGRFVPEINLEVGFEWTHRVVAGGVSLIFAVLAWLTLRRPGPRPGVSTLILAAAILLGIQIVLGALTVWLKLASWTVTAHLLTGNAFAATALWIALSLGAAAVRHPPASRQVRLWVGMAAALLFVQMTLGGLVSSRYAGLACPEWPTCNGGVWFPSWGGAVGLHLLHRLNGYALVGCLGVAAWVCRNQPRLRGSTALALLLGIAQLAVGVANVLLAIPVEVTGSHSALAAGLVLTTAYSLRATLATDST
jgi:heme A synthase